MWKRFYESTFLICVLLIAVDLQAQEKIRTSILSSRFSGVAGSPRIARNDERLWITVWRQPGVAPALLARVIGPRTGPGPFKRFAPGIAAVEDPFDIVFVRELQTFWLAYETPSALRLQRLTQNLAPAGPSTAVDLGVHQSRPHWVNDSARDRLSLFWLASADGSPSLRWTAFRHDGATIVNKRVIHNAPAGSTLTLLDAKLNEKNGMIVCLLLLQDSVSSELLAVRVNAGGSLLPPVSLSKYNGNVAIDAAAAFSTRSGQGFAIWTSGMNPLRYRLLKPDGNPAAPALDLATESLASSVSAYFDFKNNRFISIWTRSNEVRLAGFHPQSGVVTFQPAVLAHADSGTALHVQSSYQDSEGFALSAWEEFDGAGYSVRSATFQMRTSDFILQGRIKTRKTYNPPIVVDGVRYLMKYRVLSAGKKYVAFVTDETEIVGPKPDLGNWILMHFEPSRSRFRGYIEQIRIIPPPPQ